MNLCFERMVSEMASNEVFLEALKMDTAARRENARLRAEVAALKARLETDAPGTDEGDIFEIGPDGKPRKKPRKAKGKEADDTIDQDRETAPNTEEQEDARAESWRRVLETGKLLPPTEPALRMAARSPSRVYY